MRQAEDFHDDAAYNGYQLGFEDGMKSAEDLLERLKFIIDTRNDYFLCLQELERLREDYCIWK